MSLCACLCVRADGGPTTRSCTDSFLLPLHAPLCVSTKIKVSSQPLRRSIDGTASTSMSQKARNISDKVLCPSTLTRRTRPSPLFRRFFPTELGRDIMQHRRGGIPHSARFLFLQVPTGRASGLAHGAFRPCAAALLVRSRGFLKQRWPKRRAVICELVC